MCLLNGESTCQNMIASLACVRTEEIPDATGAGKKNNEIIME